MLSSSSPYVQNLSTFIVKRLAGDEVHGENANTLEGCLGDYATSDYFTTSIVEDVSNYEDVSALCQQNLEELPRASPPPPQVPSSESSQKELDVLSSLLKSLGSVIETAVNKAVKASVMEQRAEMSDPDRQERVTMRDFQITMMDDDDLSIPNTLQNLQYRDQSQQNQNENQHNLSREDQQQTDENLQNSNHQNHNQQNQNLQNSSHQNNSSPQNQQNRQNSPFIARAPFDVLPQQSSLPDVPPFLPPLSQLPPMPNTTASYFTPTSTFMPPPQFQPSTFFHIQSSVSSLPQSSLPQQQHQIYWSTAAATTTAEYEFSSFDAPEPIDNLLGDSNQMNAFQSNNQMSAFQSCFPQQQQLLFSQVEQMQKIDTSDQNFSSLEESQRSFIESITKQMWFEEMIKTTKNLIVDQRSLIRAKNQEKEDKLLTKVNFETGDPDNGLFSLKELSTILNLFSSGRFFTLEALKFLNVVLCQYLQSIALQHIAATVNFSIDSLHVTETAIRSSAIYNSRDSVATDTGYIAIVQLISNTRMEMIVRRGILSLYNLPNSAHRSAIYKIGRLLDMNYAFLDYLKIYVAELLQEVSVSLRSTQFVDFDTIKSVLMDNVKKFKFSKYLYARIVSKNECNYQLTKSELNCYHQMYTKYSSSDAQWKTQTDEDFYE